MPRLSKVKRDARDDRKTAVAAQNAADAQTASLPPGSTIEVPAQPTAISLSTNEPLAVTETNGTNSIISSRPRSPSTDSESAPGAPSVSGFVPTTAAVTAASGSKSPVVGPPSDMSTSDESENEEGGKERPVTIETGIDDRDGDDDDDMGASASGGGNPEVRCMWEDCGQVFTSLAPFITHLHEDHVGIHKARYACEWTGCPRKGKMQTSRFALLSHLRSHTGEKPFTCPRPECDKSFTRSDALAKHMRVQHNINPVSSRGRGSKGGPGNVADASVTNSGGRGSRVRATGDDDESELLGEDSIDAVGDELLELAEGEGNPSLADIESSLAFQGPTGYAYNYDNLFGPGAASLAEYTGSADYTDAELGIVRDAVPPSGPLVDDNMPDDIVIKEEDEEMARVLESGRRMWVERERERARLLESEDEVLAASKRVGVADYDSDEGAVKDENGKRKRPFDSQTALESPTAQVKAGGGRSVEQATDGLKLRKLYLIEKAKLRAIQAENSKMRLYLQDLRDMEREEKLEKRQLLERTLEAELGRDVAAIFSPPASPSR